MVRLDVSNNNIASLESLALLINLKVLDVSHNAVRTLSLSSEYGTFETVKRGLCKIVEHGAYNAVDVSHNFVRARPHIGLQRDFLDNVVRIRTIIDSVFDCAICDDAPHFEH